MLRRAAFWIIASTGLASSTLAQNNTFEVEPNDTKADAIANGPITLAPGDTITGITSAATAAGIDNFMIKTAALPAGIYLHRLVLTTGTPGHTMTIRALNQTAATAAVWPGPIGVVGATDSIGQTAVTVGNTRVIQWYGFGKQEQLYVRVTGTASTLGEYVVTLDTQPVTDVLDCGKWMQGAITITTVPNLHGNDVDLWVYDTDFNPIPGYGNDGASTNSGSTTNTNLAVYMRRHFAPGTYYIASSNGDFINNMASPSDDNRRTGFVLEYPDAALNSSATAPVHLHFTIIDAMGSAAFTSTKATANEVRWHKFVVGGSDFGACCLADGTCAIMDQARCESPAIAGTFKGPGTDCTSSTPPAPGAWLARTPAPYSRVGAGGALVGDAFYLFGGSTQSSNRTTDCWKLDLVNNLWSAIAPMPHSGSIAPQLGGVSNIDAAAIGTNIYVVGGYTGTGPVVINRVLRYDTIADSWTEITSDPYPSIIYGSGLVAHANKLYVISGATAVGSPTTSCYVYDPAAPEGSRWSPIASIEVGRPSPAVSVVGDKIYAVGGEATDQSRVDVYDIPSNTWTTGTSMTAARGGTALYTLNDQPYAASGGWTTFLSTGESFDGFNWNPAPSVITPLRSTAYDGNDQYLVRATGYNGAYRANTEFMSLSQVPTCPGNACGSSDFNGDGDFGTDADIESFFACLAGDCCPACFCQGSDFNGDGDFGTDADIESFFRVLAGGNC